MQTKLKNEFSEQKGYSQLNLSYIIKIANKYPDSAILPQAVAKWPCTHNILLIQKIKDTDTRFWYAQLCLENGWGVRSLVGKLK